jgi:hypothetical protein
VKLGTVYYTLFFEIPFCTKQNILKGTLANRANPGEKYTKKDLEILLQVRKNMATAFSYLKSFSGSRNNFSFCGVTEWNWKEWVELPEKLSFWKNFLTSKNGIVGPIKVSSCWAGLLLEEGSQSLEPANHQHCQETFQNSYLWDSL